MSHTTFLRAGLLGLGGLAAVAAMPVPEARAAAPASLFPGHAPLDDSTLHRLRGGLRVGGFEVNFAVTVTSAVEGAHLDGMRALRTTYTLTPDGGGLTSETVELDSPDTVDAGDVVAETPSSTGATLSEADGMVHISHQVTPEGITSVISNRLDEVTVSNMVELDVMVSDFVDRAGAVSWRNAVARIGDDAARLAAGGF